MFNYKTCKVSSINLPWVIRACTSKNFLLRSELNITDVIIVAVLVTVVLLVICYRNISQTFCETYKIKENFTELRVLIAQ